MLAGEKRNGQIILSVSPERQEKLAFASDNNDFHLYFSDLRYGLAQRKIAYRLLPVDKDWKMIHLRKVCGSMDCLPENILCKQNLFSRMEKRES